MLEAMAAGRPVVMADVGHIRSVVRDGVEGYIVPPGDVPALADRLRVLLGDSARCARMGGAGRDRARAHDLPAVAARLRDVLQWAARSAARPGGAFAARPAAENEHSL
jgi:D-inositol-3-phosphate glycosyltransferase